MPGNEPELDDLRDGWCAMDPLAIRADQGVRRRASSGGRDWLAVVASGFQLVASPVMWAGMEVWFLEPLVARPGQQPIGLVAVRTRPARVTFARPARTNG